MRDLETLAAFLATNRVQAQEYGTARYADIQRMNGRCPQEKGNRKLSPPESGVAALCNYLAKQADGKKRWSSSHTLKKSTSRTNDGKYNRRQIEKWANEKPGRAFWEKKYPGWILTDDDYGIQYEYNEITGWAIYLKLRKKEQKGVVVMGKPYRECPFCGAHLDAGEMCDCRKPKRKPAAAAEKLRKMRMVAVCREVNAEIGNVAVYRVCEEMTDETVPFLQIWARNNPGFR